MAKHLNPDPWPESTRFPKRLRPQHRAPRHLRPWHAHPYAPRCLCTSAPSIPFESRPTVSEVTR